MFKLYYYHIYNLCDVNFIPKQKEGIKFFVVCTSGRIKTERFQFSYHSYPFFQTI